MSTGDGNRRKGDNEKLQRRFSPNCCLSRLTSGNAPNVKVATLILCGADDDVSRRGSTPVETAKRVAELTPGCVLFLIPNTKHMTFWDGTGGLAALQEFLLRHPIAASR